MSDNSIFIIPMHQKLLYNSFLEYTSINGKQYHKSKPEVNIYQMYKNYEQYDSRETENILIYCDSGFVEFEERVIHYNIYKSKDPYTVGQEDFLDYYKEIQLECTKVKENQKQFYDRFIKHVLNSRLSNNFRIKSGDKNKLKIYDFDYNWIVESTISIKSIDKIILPNEIKENIISTIQNFYNNYERYVDLGIPYCLTFMFYGLPGTGKSSFIHALASHFKHDICKMNFKEKMTDTDLKRAFSKLPEKTFMVIEDLDCLVNERHTIDESKSHISFSGLLNTLDGINDATNRIVFMTTNSLEKIDGALKRRVHEFVEFTYSTNKQKEQMLKLFFPNISQDIVDKFKAYKTTTNILQKFLIKYIDTGIKIDDINSFDTFNNDYLKNSFNNMYI